MFYDEEQRENKPRVLLQLDIKNTWIKILIVITQKQNSSRSTARTYIKTVAKYKDVLCSLKK